jgi:serine/threonine protein kinase
MDADRNLLFGVLALQADLISQDQFVQVCTLWTARKDIPLADLLLEQGWVTLADRAAIDRLLECKLKKHHGDASTSLAEVVSNQVQRLLAVLNDADVQRSLDQLSQHDGDILLSTVTRLPDTRERYTLTRLHATGGIGRVWLARDSSLGREVALKELQPERIDNPAFWSRFLKEAQITGQLEHPGIVPVYELSRQRENQQPFYTMRFVKGRTLTDAIQAYHRKRKAGQAGPLDLAGLLNAFVGVCQAVAYAHSRGVIHRDLKGQNVVLGDYGEVILLDWGLAKLVDRPEEDAAALPVVMNVEGKPEGTVQGQVLGTPAYMAPEQAQGRLDLIDRRTDVYGLGAMLYEILTGQPPFAGIDTEDLLRKVREEQPERPRAFCTGVPAALEAVCLMALAKRPAARYDIEEWYQDRHGNHARAAGPNPVRSGDYQRRLCSRRQPVRHCQRGPACAPLGYEDLAAGLHVRGLGACRLRSLLSGRQAHGRRDREEQRGSDLGHQGAATPRDDQRAFQECHVGRLCGRWGKLVVGGRRRAAQGLGAFALPTL